MYSELLSFSDEILQAQKDQKPIVALESTIIAHGMPFPQNAETALEIEQIIREKGAVPATIALMNGKIKIGLTTAEITALGRAGSKVQKVSRRDMANILARQEMGATTVAATMIAAEMAKIPVFATGGIGGVHRAAEITMDISADLQELAQTQVAVISAGAKSILDLGLTLEYLETHGVPVLGYQTSTFPAFFVRDSGFSVDIEIQSTEQLAQTIDTHWKIPNAGGILIANPIPEMHEPEFKMIDEAIQAAIREAQEQKITGKALTPFLLSRIEQLTQGKSLKANIQLVKNNARLAASLAIALNSIKLTG